MGGNAKWWLALGGAAFLLMVVFGVAVLQRRARPAPVAAATATTADAGTGAAISETTPARAEVARDGCGLPRELSLSEGDGKSPVLLWAVAPVRLFLDDKPAFSGPDRPLRLSGEHTLRLEAKGEEPLVTKFRVHPGTPALFHAQVDEGLGITLVRLGASCTSCVAKDADVEIDVERSDEPAFSLLQSAASTLRSDQWRLALARLRRVPPKDRTKIPFLRLASNLSQATGDAEKALGFARMIPKGRSNELTSLLDALARLGAAEDRTRPEGLFQRWNDITDRFGAIASKYADTVPGPLAAATRRLEKLSQAFENQVNAKDARGQRGTVDAAEETVLQLVKELRAVRPADCAFQSEVVATVTP